MAKSLPILFLYLVLHSLSHAQKAGFTLYTTEDGLASNRVWSITQDNHGFLWINTGTLNRFDGIQFMNRNNQRHPVFQRSLEAASLFHIDDKIIYSQDRSIFTINYISGQESIIELDSILPDGGFTKQDILIKGIDGELIIPVINKEETEVTIFKLKDKQLTKAFTIPDIYIGAKYKRVEITCNAEGDLFYLTNDFRHLVQVDRKGNLVSKIKLPEGVSHNISSGIPIIKSAHNNSMITISHGSIYILYQGATEFIPHPSFRTLQVDDHISIVDLHQTSQGDIWVSGNARQLILMEKSSGMKYDFHEDLKAHLPNQLNLNDIFSDQTGVIWIRTIMGLLKVTPRKSWFANHFDKQSEACRGYCSFRGFTEDDAGNIFASCYSNLFQVQSHGQDDYTSLLPFAHTPFDLLYTNGRILLNDGREFDPSTGEVSNPYNSENVEYVDMGIFTTNHDGLIWWGYSKHLYVLNTKESPTQWRKIFSLPPRTYGLITEVKYDPSNNYVWIGGQAEIRALNISTGEIEGIYKPVENEDIHMRYIHPDENGGLWIGSEGGLFYFSTIHKIWKRFRVEDGLANNYVSTILAEGDSCLWLGTNNGLSRFSISTESFINFYEEDGLPHNEFNRRSAFKASDGTFYFGGIRGITSFRPDELIRQHTPERPSEQLSLISFSRTDINLDTTFTDLFLEKSPTVDLFFENKTSAFEFALTDYSIGENLQYSYKLDGFENIWSKPSYSNKVNFNLLPKGQYTLRIKALDNKGNWHPNQLSVNINVFPPWWHTNTAYVGYFMALLLLGTAVFFFLKRRWQIKNALLLEQQEANRLKDLNDFKSRLYTNLTHEFRTPLTVILGMVSQIEIDPKKHLDESLSLIKRNGKNLLSLVNQMLDLSKIEARQMPVSLIQDDIAEYIHFITESFTSMASRKNISIQFNSHPDKISMDYDADKIQQIISNLLSNAIKFTPSGGRITVDLEKIESANKTKDTSVQIKVSDTGIGIPEDQLPHIFDRFYQVDATHTRKSEGTGIGLALTRELVKLLSGDITASSTEGTGSRFTITLPITNNAQAIFQKEYPLRDHEESSDPTGFGNQVRSDKRLAEDNRTQILLIEDNTDVMIYLERCLESQYRILKAQNGEEGITAAIENIPDLVISDVMMPYKDGFEVCDSLKNNELTSHIPLILLTALNTVEDRIKGLRRGADDYMGKPFSREELQVRVTNLLASRKRLQERYRNLNASTVIDLSPDEAPENAFLQKLRQFIEADLDRSDLSISEVCAHMTMSRMQLHRKIKALTGRSTAVHIRAIRLHKAQELLQHSDLNISEIAFAVGFEDPKYFSRVFSEEFGMPPSEAKVRFN